MMLSVITSFTIVAQLKEEEEENLSKLQFD